MQFNRPPPAQLVCVCLSLCVVHAQCCQVPGSPCRTGPAGIEQIRSLVSVVLHTDTYRPGRQVFRTVYPVLPGGRNSGQKAQKGPQKKKFLAEFWLILPKTGRKGAAENIQKKFLIFSCDNCDKFDF